MVAIVLVSNGGRTGPPAPGASIESLCAAAGALAEAVSLARQSSAANEAGDGLAAADLADEANPRRQDGMAFTGWAGALEGAQNLADPGIR